MQRNVTLGPIIGEIYDMDVKGQKRSHFHSESEVGIMRYELKSVINMV